MTARLRVPLIVSLLALAGCHSVPTESFNSYLQSFASVKTNADDLYLRSTLTAENIANRPEKEGTVTDRLNELEARRAALDVCLGAVALIDRYNKILVNLAAGQTPEAVKSDIIGLQQDLSSLNIRRVTALVGKAAPYLEVVTQGIAIIEDALKKKKFAEAVTAAQKPLAGILDILAADADNLEDLLVQDILREQDPYFKQISSYGSRLNKRIKEMKATPEIDALLIRMNLARQSLGHESVTPISPQPAENSPAPSSTDVDALTAIVGQTEQAAASYNKIKERVSAERAVFKEYKNALSATKTAFVAMKSDMDTGRYAATADFIQQARALRKATLRLREAR